MPVYQFRCAKCGRLQDIYLKINDRNLGQSCDSCGGPALREVTAAFVSGDYEAYQCPITGKEVRGRRQHEENLKRHDCRVLEPGERELNSRRRQQAEAALDKSVEATVDEFITKLPAAKREKLVNEVAAGASATVARQ